MKPRFSVVMPLYNKAPYVRKAVERKDKYGNYDYHLMIII